MTLLQALLYDSRSEDVPREVPPASPASPKPFKSSQATEWLAASADRVARIGSSARLYPLLDCKVRTPRGIGVLRQVFENRAAVLLDGDDKFTSFSPDEVCSETLM